MKEGWVFNKVKRREDATNYQDAVIINNKIYVVSDGEDNLSSVQMGLTLITL